MGWVSVARSRCMLILTLCFNSRRSFLSLLVHISCLALRLYYIGRDQVGRWTYKRLKLGGGQAYDRSSD
jgi:hypothetical protein